MHAGGCVHLPSHATANLSHVYWESPRAYLDSTPPNQNRLVFLQPAEAP